MNIPQANRLVNRLDCLQVNRHQSRRTPPDSLHRSLLASRLCNLLHCRLRSHLPHRRCSLVASLVASLLVNRRILLEYLLDSHQCDRLRILRDSHLCSHLGSHLANRLAAQACFARQVGIIRTARLERIAKRDSVETALRGSLTRISGACMKLIALTAHVGSSQLKTEKQFAKTRRWGISYKVPAAPRLNHARRAGSLRKKASLRVPNVHLVVSRRKKRALRSWTVCLLNGILFKAFL